MNSISKGLQSGDILSGCDHLCDEKESNGGGQHVAGYTREVIGVVLHLIELRGIELTWEIVNSKSNCYD